MRRLLPSSGRKMMVAQARGDGEQRYDSKCILEVGFPDTLEWCRGNSGVIISGVGVKDASKVLARTV